MAIQPTGIRYYFSNPRQALSEACNKACILSETICNRVNEFQKKSQLCSMAINTARNTVPISAYLLTNYLLPETPSMTPLPWMTYGAYLTAQLTKDYLVPLACTAYGAYLANDYLYKDEHKTLDRIISQLDTLSKQEFAPIGDAEKAPFEELLSRDLTLYDCKHLAEDLLYNQSQRLFNWHSITGSHRKPFKKLITQVEANIEHSPQLQGRLLLNTQIALDDVLSKLTELKATRSGLYTSSHQQPDIHPRLKELSQAMTSFHQELLAPGSQYALNASIDELTRLIETCLRRTSIFTKITANHEIKPISDTDKAYFETLKEDLNTLKTLRINTVFFTKKRTELTPILERCQEILSIKPSSIHKVALTTQSLPQEDVEEVSLFETLLDTLTTCNGQDRDKEQAVIKQLLKSIDLTYDLRFEEAFTEHAHSTPHETEDRLKVIFVATLKSLCEEGGFNQENPSINDYIAFLSNYTQSV